MVRPFAPAAFAASLLFFVVSPAAAQKVLVTEPISALEARVRADSNDPAAHYNVAMGYLGAKRYDDAERALRQSVAIDPRFADAWLALSMVQNWNEAHWKRIRREGGDSAVIRAIEAGNRHYTRAFLIDPLVDIRILGGTYKVGSSRSSQAFEALVEGRYDEAAEKYGRVIASWDGGKLEKVPEDLLWLRSLATSRAGKFDEAIADLEEVLARFTRKAAKDSTGETPLEANEYRYMMAALHQRAGRADTAARLYRQVLEHDVSNYMAHVQLARLHETGRQWELAVVERRRAVETNPDDPSLLLDLGITLGKAGRFADASTALEQAVAAGPRDARAWYWLGIARLQEARRDDARTAFARFVELAPSRYDRQLATARQRLAELK